MINDPANPARKPLRLWPGVAVAVLLVLAKVISRIYPFPAGTEVLVAFVGMAAILVWWLFFSRAPWPERLGAVALMIVAVFATKPFLHESIAGGMAGMMVVLYVLSLVLGPAFVVWAVFSRRRSSRVRRASMVATIVLACAVWTLFRIDGVTGNLTFQFTWRWAKTAEERLLAQSPEVVAPETPATSPAPDAEPRRPEGASAAPPASDKPGITKVQWGAFRGTDRDSVVRGLRIETDWSKSPPAEMWRRPIGPGWSSFAVGGDLFYTQEQRGPEEIVGSYRVATGKPVWQHRDPVRFRDASGDAGPRGTPTLSNGRVYAFSATGILTALDASSGKLLWSRNVATDTGRKVPDWGFSSSPLVMDDMVIVAASGTLAAYDASNGSKRWIGPRKLATYSSPHHARIAGVDQVLLLSGSGAVSVAPASGEVQWEHEWAAGGATIVQPAMTEDGDVLINAMSMPSGAGIRRLRVTHESGAWNVSERWTSTGLKPHFNDFVIHKGHAYGFDGSILACIDLEDGTRKWKGGRYGNGQMLLLADQDTLLVISEDGELALVGATPDRFSEMARFKAIEGKTWNHPAIAGDVLLVRNGEEMAAFRLPLAGR